LDVYGGERNALIILRVPRPRFGLRPSSVTPRLDLDPDVVAVPLAALTPRVTQQDFVGLIEKLERLTPRLALDRREYFGGYLIGGWIDIVIDPSFTSIDITGATSASSQASSALSISSLSTSLVLEFAERAELHQPRDFEGHARQFRFSLGFPRSGAAFLGHNL
jgi:hypothetical protein